jgi:diguanylate cyclase (GGDEF)-like protein
MRMNRFYTLCAGLLVHVLLCCVALVLDIGEISVYQAFLLVGVAVAGFLAFTGLIYFELNLSFEDPDLSLLQPAWALLLVMASAWFTAELKPLLMITGLTLIQAGLYRLGRRNRVLFSCIGIGLYVMLLALDYMVEGLAMSWPRTLLEFAVFTIVLVVAPMFIRFDRNLMQHELSGRNRLLNNALERINTLVIRDELTGAYNRHHLENLLDQQKAMADRRDYIFSLCHIDLDHFKRVNDLFGRHTGDVFLQGFVHMVKSVLRDVDNVARISGEEFVLILGGISEQEALVVARRIRSLLQDLSVSPSGPDYRVTASVGISQYIRGENHRETLQRADLSLFRAKRSGKDRIIIAESALAASIAG